MSKMTSSHGTINKLDRGCPTHFTFTPAGDHVRVLKSSQELNEGDVVVRHHLVVNSGRTRAEACVIKSVGDGDDREVPITYTNQSGIEITLSAAEMGLQGGSKWGIFLTKAS